jgi:competence protein ComEC
VAGLWLGLFVGARLLVEPAASVTVFRSGEAVWIDRPGRSADLLLDTGDASTAKAVVVPFLQSRGVDRPPTLAVSHGDTRHLGGVPVVLTSAPPDSLVIPTGRMRSPGFRALDGLAASNGVPLRRVSRGGSVATLPVLHPDAADGFTRADDGSMVLRLEVAGWRILLAPDLGPEGQAALVRRDGPGLAADVLITGVPAVGDAASDAFLAQVAPRLVVVATGERPATERSPASLRRRMRGRPWTTWWTERTGALELRCREDRIEILDAAGTLRHRIDRIGGGDRSGPDQGSATAR